MLEADYCRVIEKEEEEVRDDSDDALLSEAVLYEDPSPQIAEDIEEETVVSQQAIMVADSPKSAPANSHTLWWKGIRGIALLMIFTVLIASFSAWRYLEAAHNRLKYEEQESNVYSNIRLYEIYPPSHANNSKDQLYNKLKGTLYQMNLLLKGQSIVMDVYYQSIDQTLNYTFSLKSSCDNKQLAMAIYHWRIDINQLNNLILRETRRKIGEMEGCSVG